MKQQGFKLRGKTLISYRVSAIARHAHTGSGCDTKVSMMIEESSLKPAPLIVSEICVIKVKI